MRALIVVDMQNDCIDGSLGTKDAQAILSNVKNKIEQYKKNNDVIIFTRDTHNEDYLETQEGKNLPVKHCVKDTKGWEISKELLTEGYKVINKDTFGSLELVDYLKQDYKEFDEIELVGLCTDICVISNAMILKAAFLKSVIKVDASACAGVTKESHKNALEAMKMCQIKIINE